MGEAQRPTTAITLELPDELATRLAAVQDRLPELLSTVLKLSLADMSYEQMAILLLFLLRGRGMTADEIRATLAGLAEQDQLRQEGSHGASRKSDRMAALAQARAIGDQIRAWQERHGVHDIDSVTLLNQLRAEHDHDLANLR